MPRIRDGGPPRPVTSIRIDPGLREAVRSIEANLSRAIDAGLRTWLAREQQRQARGTKRLGRR
jgi:hypothetical protein